MLRVLRLLGLDELETVELLIVLADDPLLSELKLELDMAEKLEGLDDDDSSL